MKSSRAIRTLASALIGMSTLSAVAPAAMAEPARDVRFERSIRAYSEAHPDDLTGLSELVESWGGTLDVKSTATASADPAQIETAVARFEATGMKDDSTLESGVATMGGDASVLGNFASDVFVVSIWSASNSSGTAAVVSGQTNWRDNFAGQSAPYDVASIQFSNTCGSLTNHTVSTWNVYGTKTSGSSLRDSGVGSKAPIWNIDARSVGFVNTADKSKVTVTYNRSGCGGSTIQAGYTYEGNQGGTLGSVSAGWGGLNVSYSASPGLTLQKSTGALTLKFTTSCTTSVCPV